VNLRILAILVRSAGGYSAPSRAREADMGNERLLAGLCGVTFVTLFLLFGQLWMDDRIIAAAAHAA
jgi:hypothetical protein